MVAKSYQKMKILCDPYAKANGRLYIKVLAANGNEREVRWYSDSEYAKMYPNDAPKETDLFANQKDILGFQEGYITIFKGDTDKYEWWFERSIARFCRFWGWYIVSTDPLPFDLPVGIEPVQLNWEMVGVGLNLRPDEEVRAAVSALLHGLHPSVFQGAVGDRLELEITVIKCETTENHFGKTYHHVFEDCHGNHYVWKTSAKCWSEGTVKHIRGSVKEHAVMNNIQTTILTRCLEVSK